MNPFKHPVLNEKAIKFFQVKDSREIIEIEDLEMLVFKRGLK